MKVFNGGMVGSLAFESVVRKPEKLGAIQVDDDFHVPHGNGDLETGGPGDYLVCDSSDRLFIVKKADFEREFRSWNKDVDV